MSTPLPAHLTPQTAKPGTIVSVLLPSGGGTDGRAYTVHEWMLCGPQQFALVDPCERQGDETDGRHLTREAWRVMPINWQPALIEVSA